MNKPGIILLIFILGVMLMSCTQQVPQFNGENAYKMLVEQCDLGPRPPGSAEIELCRDYIIDKLHEYGAEVKLQKFKAEVQGMEFDGVNITGSFYPRLSRRILLGAHYDTRPWADRDSLEANHSQPVLGANDGASGVAVLLEIGRILANEMPAEYGIDLVFFDMEDMGSYEEDDTWCVGSEYFAQNWEGEKPEKSIVIDMVGDIDLRIPIEYHSYHNSPLLVRQVWDIAWQLGVKEFETRIDNAVRDDHYSLIKAGFEAIDIIDFEYEWWHTVHDTPDKCSAVSLQAVGQVVVNLIYQK
jgi:Peptidase family M28